MALRTPTSGQTTDTLRDGFLREPEGWLERTWSLLQGRLHPARGWLALGGTLALALLPLGPLETARFIRTGSSFRLLLVCAVASVLLTWLLLGWGRNRMGARHGKMQMFSIAVALLWMGAIAISLFIVEWMPPAGVLWRALVTWNGYGILLHLQVALETLNARVALWQLGGTASGGDELIVASLLGALIWLLGITSAALCRWGSTGIVVSLPSLVITAIVVVSSGSGRWTFLAGLAIALGVSLTLDNGKLLERWHGQSLDFSPELLLERWMNAFALAAISLGLAAALASISFASISEFVTTLLTPVSETIETASEETFPGVTFANRQEAGNGGEIPARITGLPNEFLLGAGPEPSNERILELRTSDMPTGDDSPAAPYLFSRAYTNYVGTGWTPESYETREVLVPNDRRPTVGIVGRRLLAQSIARIAPIEPAPFAADIAETGVQAVLDLDPAGQVVRMNSAARNYTVLSSQPAMGVAELSVLPAWETPEYPLPAGFERFLALPESVTDRTRELSAALVEGIDAPYLQAAAIEMYLRGFAYDLSIDAPPPEVTDVADFFLFDLQRGYCDYFATAFVVLARAAGLPARFVAGYAPGVWQPESRAWLVTASKSHAWPEVYLPQIGWVAFEPTSGLPPLSRISIARSYVAPDSPPLPEPEPESPAIIWNWQMLFWLAPIALGIWLVWTAIDRVRRHTEDPWESLAKWGARRGRPLQPWETPGEYAAAVAALAGTLGTKKAETAKTVQRESIALGDAVARERFAPEGEKAVARQEVRNHWKRMRDLLPYLR